MHGLAVNEPFYIFGSPAVAVLVIFFGRIETKVVHIFVVPHSVHEIVELHFGSITAQKLDIYLVVRVRLAFFVLVVRTGTCKERTRGTRLFRRLHLNGVIAVTEILVRTGFTRKIPVVGLHRTVGVFGNSKVHCAVLIRYVLLSPRDVEYVAVRPAVRFEKRLRRAFAEIGKHGSLKRRSTRGKRTCGKHGCKYYCRQYFNVLSHNFLL